MPNRPPLTGSTYLIHKGVPVAQSVAKMNPYVALDGAGKEISCGSTEEWARLRAVAKGEHFPKILYRPDRPEPEES